MQTTPSAHACTPPTTGTEAAHAPYTLRFTTWECGHHGTRPDDIPCHSIEQAQAIVRAIGYAISQPGHARAALFGSESGASVYLTDDHADTIPTEDRWAQRTTIYHATPEELAELLSLQTAFDYAYFGQLRQWDGTTYLDDMEVVTTMDMAAIKEAITPVSWYESGKRREVCDVPPIIKPASVLLEELRVVAQDMATDAVEQGGAA